MKIHQIYTANQLRNFNYLLETKHGDIYCIDPWDAKDLSREIEKLGKPLKAVVNTHEHFDHVRGNEGLVQEWGSEVWAHENAREKIPYAKRGLAAHEEIDLGEGESLKVLDTPGHTMAHLCLLVLDQGRPTALLSGDTLFNAGVGNCHNGGDPETLYETISGQIATLPDEVLVYPGHDYLLNNLRFTMDREPGNTKASQLLAERGKMPSDSDFLTTNLGLEKEINTFFRLGSVEIRTQLGMDESTSDKEVFLALREKRNHW